MKNERKSAQPAASVKAGAKRRKMTAGAMPGHALKQERASYGARTAGKARSAAFASIHSAVQDLHDADGIDLVTMRNFDQACLSDQALNAQDVRSIRRSSGVSQSVFARYLGTSESTVKQWESGAKQPSGMARTLLNAVRKHGIAVLS
ncbi:DNA-binding transcriptional regulator [Herbaspirillum sp. WKF16]|uniref:helix-turn-helix domain-containing protein n=1 Tax=Herbaspirillum sp. WKF16 TaxID=3028312 RepID=UPI0023A98824|nr:DNA-binding transcriptional regulator [Herbaspirillum sp. WKF16]WDZ97575.1 DNA-binding transcriptional regulator [Herbaspirillum sp. WKF16]